MGTCGARALNRRPEIQRPLLRYFATTSTIRGMDALIDLFATAQEGLFETFFQPLAFAWGFASRLENVYEATGWLLIGLL